MAEWRKYGAATTILFPLIDAGAVDFESTPVTFAAGDTQVSKDEGVFANTSNNPAHEGNGIYSLALTAAEMQAARIVVTIIDSATKAWEDQAVIVETYGNASAQHAFDLDDAQQTVDVASGGITSGSFAAGAIDAAAIAADAIGASELASDAVDEIVDQVWDEAKSGHVGAGSFGEEVQAHALSTEITALNDLSAAQVNTEVADVMKADTIAEMAQQAPPTNPTFEEAVMYLYMALVHKVDITATLKEFHNDAGTVIWKKTLSDDGHHLL